MGKGGMNRDGITVRPLYHEIDPWKVRMGLFLCLSLEVYSYCKLEWFSHATVVEWGRSKDTLGCVACIYVCCHC